MNNTKQLKNEQSVSDLWENNKRTNVYTLGLTKGMGKKQRKYLQK